MGRHQRFAIGEGTLVLFVDLVNEKRRWPLVVLIVMYALGINLGISWIIAADASGTIMYKGVAYPVIIWWITLGSSVLATYAFVWHYRLYKRTAWSRARDPD